MTNIINIFNQMECLDPFDDPLEFLKFDSSRLLTEINLTRGDYNMGDEAEYLIALEMGEFAESDYLNANPLHNNYSRNVSLHGANWEEMIWVTKNNHELLISKMSNDHIDNTIRMIERNGNTDTPEYGRLRYEQLKRMFTGVNIKHYDINKKQKIQKEIDNQVDTSKPYKTCNDCGTKYNLTPEYEIDTWNVGHYGCTMANAPRILKGHKDDGCPRCKNRRK